MTLFILVITVTTVSGFNVKVRSLPVAFKTELSCLKSAERVKEKYQNKYDLFHTKCYEEKIYNKEMDITLK